MSITPDELKIINNSTDWFKEYGDGYCIVYFYDDDKYKVGQYSKTIEGFMYNFIDDAPLFDEEDVPDFISNDDLLERFLDMAKEANKVALYKTDGTVVEEKQRIVKKV